MVKLRWLKEWKTKKAGDVSLVGSQTAENVVSQGYAEYVEEPKKSKEKKVKANLKETIRKIRAGETTPRKYPGEEPPTKEEARYASDAQTLNNQVGDKPCTMKDLLILNVLPENYQEWRGRKNAKAEAEEKKEFTRADAEKKALELAGLKPEKIFQPQVQVKFYLEEQPIFYDKNCIWWIWESKNKMWEVSNEIDILNKIERITGEDIITPKNRILILNSLKQECRKTKPQDIEPTWIQFKDRIYDIATCKSFEASPDYFISNPIMWNLGESEDTPKIDELFKSWVAEEDIIKLYEILAFVIVPSYFIHGFFFLFGPPGHGKSTFLNLIINFIGKHNITSTTLDRINHNPRFETINWYKKLLVCMSEVHNIHGLKNSSLINTATGQDSLIAEIKGGKTFEFVNYGKFVYPTNKLVKVDAEDGFGRRVRKIDFINQYQKEKDVLNEIPDYEFENLARKCLRIARDLWIKRQFTGDVNIVERMKQYQDASKTLLEKFIESHCEIASDDERLIFDNFYVRLAKYYKMNNKTEVPSKVLVGKELRNLGFKNTNASWINNLLDDDFSKRYTSKNTIFGLKFKEENSEKV